MVRLKADEFNLIFAGFLQEIWDKKIDEFSIDDVLTFHGEKMFHLQSEEMQIKYVRWLFRLLKDKPVVGRQYCLEEVIVSVVKTEYKDIVARLCGSVKKPTVIRVTVPVLEAEGDYREKRGKVENHNSVKIQKKAV